MLAFWCSGHSDCMNDPPGRLQLVREHLQRSVSGQESLGGLQDVRHLPREDSESVAGADQHGLADDQSPVGPHERNSGQCKFLKF